MSIGRFEGTITSAAYSTPELTLESEPVSTLIINHDQAIANDVFLSFDGATDHGRLPGGASLRFKSPTRKVFLRKGAGGNPLVQIISEG